MDKDKQRQLYVFQIERNYSSFYKNVLYEIEGLKQDGRITADEYQRIRKRILDLGNDSRRELVDYAEIFFK